MAFRISVTQKSKSANGVSGLMGVGERSMIICESGRLVNHHYFDFN